MSCILIICPIVGQIIFVRLFVAGIRLRGQKPADLLGEGVVGLCHGQHLSPRRCQGVGEGPVDERVLGQGHFPVVLLVLGDQRGDVVGVEARTSRFNNAIVVTC